MRVSPRSDALWIKARFEARACVRQRMQGVCSIPPATIPCSGNVPSYGAHGHPPVGDAAQATFARGATHANAHDIITRTRGADFAVVYALKADPAI